MTVGIIGGGITGLVLHHTLRSRGVESRVFEANDEPGGVIESTEVEGRVLDTGPQRTRLSPGVASLVEELGVEAQCLEAPDLPLYVYRDGGLRRVPFSVREALSTDLLSWRGKLRVLLEPLTGPPRAGESVETFLTRTLGDEAARYVVGPLYGGIYGSHPDEMPVEHSLGRALERHGVTRSLLATVARARLTSSETPPVVSFADGLQTLPQALYDRHRDRVSLSTPVESVREAADGYRLETADGAVTVETVVCTTPAAVTASLLESVAPATAAPLERLQYNSLVTVHLASDANLQAAGYQIQYDEGFHTLGVTCNESLFDRDGVYTCYLGGSTASELLDWSTDKLERTAVDEFRAVTGSDARPLAVSRRRAVMPAYDYSWTALDNLELPADIHLCANYRARAGIPGRVRDARQLATRLAGDANPDSTQPS